MFIARKLGVITLTSFLLCFSWSGCDFLEQTEDAADPDDPSGPGNDPPIAVNDITKTITTQGGALEVDGMTLLVPAGALDSETSLTLARVSQVPDILSDEAVTRSYTLSGLPESFGGPMELALSIDGDVEDSSFVVVGIEGYIPTLGRSVRTYEFLPARVVDSTLVTELPAAPQGSSSRAKRTVGGFLEFFGVSKYRTVTSSDGHFVVRYPKKDVQRSKAEAAARHLEDAYTAHEQFGLSFAGRTRWPVHVEFVKLEADKDGQFVPSYRGDNYGTIEFNKTGLDDDTELRVTAGHELLHLLQYLYDPRWAFNKKKFASDFQWVNEATAVWCERGMSGDAGYISPILSGREMAPFEGLHAPAETADPNEHGYGMSTFVKYVVDKHGPETIASWYRLFKDGQHPVTAINASLDYRLTIEWEPFLRKYVMGEIYDVQPSRFMNSAWDSFIPRTKDDTLKVFSESYPDLSGRTFFIRFHPDLPAYSSGAALKLSIDQPLADVTAFIYDGTASQPMTFHSHSLDSLLITDLKGLQSANKRIVILVSNTNFVEPYTNETPINLTAKIVEVPSSYKAFVEWSVHAFDWKVTDSNGNSWESGTDGPWSIGSTFYDYSWGALEDRQDSQYFTSTWNSNPLYDSGSGSVNLTFNKDLTEIMSFDAKSVANSSSGSINYYIKGRSLPAASTGAATRVYEVTGSATCSHIDAATLYMKSSNFLGLTGELGNYNCDQTSYLRVTLQSR